MNRWAFLKFFLIAGGLLAVVLPIYQAAQHAAGYQPFKALCVALGAMSLLTAVLLLAIRTVRVANRDLEWTDVEDSTHIIKAGWLVPSPAPDTLKPAGARPDAEPPTEAELKTAAPERKVSALRALYRGKDNRASTSKAVALAWTYVIAFGLLALLSLKLMGDDVAWTKLIGNDSLQEEYLLLLGGPYAAAVIAKYTSVAGAAAETKTSDPTGGLSSAADIKSLVADDAGDTDIGDFQYVLFNIVALAFVLGTLILHPRNAFPDLPALLVGLALTSAATYTAKKAAAGAAGPQLTSIFPSTAKVGAGIDLYGRNLVSDGQVPKISVGPASVTRVNVLKSAGSGDHLKFKLPTLDQGDQPVRVTHAATGATAIGPGGTDSLNIKVIA